MSIKCYKLLVKYYKTTERVQILRKRILKTKLNNIQHILKLTIYNS